MIVLFKNKRIIIRLSIILLVTVAVFTFGPPAVEKRMNRVAPDPAAKVSPDAKRLHDNLFVADMHADSLLFDRNLLKRSSYGHVDIPRLLEGNVALQFFTVVTKSPKSQNIESNDSKSDRITSLAILQGWPVSTWSSLKERALYQSQKLHKFAKQSQGKFVLIKTSGDLEKHLESREKSPGTVAGLLGLEGAHALEGNISNLDVLYDSGYRMIAPTHFFDNELGGSAHGIEKGGLTPFGRDVVGRLEELHILIDIAHASPQMMDDILDMTTKPVVVSHTGVKGVCNNNRNLGDQHIRRIAQKGGVIGIGFWDDAVGSTDVKAIARSIRYVADLVGVKHVALGSDYDGTITAPFDAAKMALLTEALLAEGFKEPEIRLIMGENVVRVLKEVLPP